MKIIELIKRFFSRFNIKKIEPEADVSKVIRCIKAEKDLSQVEKLIENNLDILTSADILDIISSFNIRKRMYFLSKFRKYITPYNLAEFISKKLNQDGKVEALKEFQNQLDIYDIYKIFTDITPDRRTEALSNIIDRLDSYGLSEIIKEYIPLVERKEVMFKYEGMLDPIAKVLIVPKLMPNDILDVIEKYKNEFTSLNLVEIIKALPSDKVALGLGMCEDKLTDNQIMDIISFNIPENQRLKSLFEVSDRLNSAALSDIIKYSLDDKNKKLALLQLKYKLDEKNVAEIIQCYMSKDFEIIEKLKDKMYEEDVAYFRNGVM